MKNKLIEHAQTNYNSSPQRNFYNRRWKALTPNNELEINQDSYTDNELNIWAGGINRNSVSTMVKKTDLLSFAEGLQNRADQVFTDASDYDSGWFKAKKTTIGYQFTVKGLLILNYKQKTMQNTLVYFYYLLQSAAWVLSLVFVLLWTYNNWNTTDVKTFEWSVFMMVWFIWTNNIFKIFFKKP